MHLLLRYKVVRTVFCNSQKEIKRHNVNKQSSKHITSIDLTLDFQPHTPGINHRIIEQFGLEGTFRGHLVQPDHNEQGHLQLDQVAQSPIQPDLECFHGWGIYHLSGQPVPVFHYPNNKKFLHYI